MTGIDRSMSFPRTTMAQKSALPFKVRDYLFTDVIGHGGFAEVYLVTHCASNREYVAKVMTLNIDDRESRWKAFDAEVTALSCLEHPHIVKLYDHFCINNQFYMILEYCPAGSLHNEIYSTDGVTSERFLQLSHQIVSALSYCHERGIAHRDVKPGNILLDAYGNAKVADFGLSYHGDVCKSQAGSITFTAPEIFENRPHDPKAGDIWALGVVFAMMATGASPWPCDCVGTLKKLVANGNFQLQKSVPDLLLDLLTKMIVVDPAKRLTIREVGAHLTFMSPRVKHVMSKIPMKMRFHEIGRRSDADLQSDFGDFEDVPFSAHSTRFVTPTFVAQVKARVRRERYSNAVRPSTNIATFADVEEL